MTEAMISRLPARRDGTGYAFILRDGLTPVIARPPIIWHGPGTSGSPAATGAATSRPSCCRKPPPGRMTWRGMTPRRCRPPHWPRRRRPRPGTPGNGNGDGRRAGDSPAGPGPRGHGTGRGAPCRADLLASDLTAAET